MAGNLLLRSIGDELGMFWKLLEWQVHLGNMQKKNTSNRVASLRSPAEPSIAAMCLLDAVSDVDCLKNESGL